MSPSELEVIRRLADVVNRVHRGGDLTEVLQAITDGVIEGVGLAAAAVNTVRPDGDFAPLAVSGVRPEDVDTLLGSVVPRGFVEHQMATGERWGHLLYLQRPDMHSQEGTRIVTVSSAATWEARPAESESSDQQGRVWHEEDCLLAPLRDGTGLLIGFLSVDLVPGAPLPDPVTQALLQVFADSAGLALSRYRLLEALRRERTSLRSTTEAFVQAFETSAGPIASVFLGPGHVGRFRTVNREFASLLRSTPNQLVGRPLESVVADAHVTDAQALLLAMAARDTASAKKAWEMRRADGTHASVNLTASAVFPSDPAGPFAMVQIVDLTELRNNESELKRLAYTDPLTGLANRRALLNPLRDHAPGVILFIDLDDFKAVNDRYDHRTGDRVLIEVARRIREAVRPQDLVARIGGDEFVVVAEGLSQDDAPGLARRISQSVGAISLPHPEVRVGVSVGVVPMSQGDDIGRRLAAADSAMYRAKRGE